MKIQITADLLDGMVLAILEHGNYYGYALTQRMQESVTVSESTMYPVLRRLKKSGCLTTYDQPYQGRNRRYYRITDDGKKRLQQIRQLWHDYKASLDKILGADEKGEQV